MVGSLNGKVACITGAANGIGRATAEVFASEGAQVLGLDLNRSAGEALVERIAQADGYCQFMELDVTDEDRWRKVATDIQDRYGRLDVLINNAGVGLAGPVTEIALDDWRRIMAVNVEGTFLGIKHCLPLIRQGGGGSIVNVSSIAGIKPSANASAYSASKGAVRMMTRSVALECAGEGVRVNSVYPGIVDTAIWDDLLPGPGTQSGRARTMAQLADCIPMGRAGGVEEIARAILWLASDDSSYLTGTELVIDGGRSIS